ncbi:MAG: hypothetical protein HZC51_08165 [Nitrospirae bacterium]|nr:hypothetical protein [Nitrospirota bacterium]
MQRACDIGKKRKMDPVLRRYILVCASVFAAAGLFGGFYLGFGFVTNEAAAEAPLFEKFFLSTFLSISFAAGGMIIGAAIGSTIYRFKERGEKKGK